MMIFFTNYTFFLSLHRAAFIAHGFDARGNSDSTGIRIGCLSNEAHDQAIRFGKLLVDLETAAR